MSQGRPPQGALTCLLLVVFSLSLAPFTLLQCATAYLRASRSKIAQKQKRKQSSVASSIDGGDRSSWDGNKAVVQGSVALVNGGRMQKALYVVRALHRQGYRVVLVEERGWGELCATRFSNSVHHFELVPSGGGEAYIDALVDVARRWNAALFVPCSGAGTTVEDARAAEIMRQRGKIQTLIQDADLVETLHEKDQFIDLVHELGLQAPTSTLLHSADEALAHLRSQDTSGDAVLLKAATVLDDVGRSDMTTYPVRDGQGQVDWQATQRRIRSGLHIPISRNTPYVAQEFVGGEKASEWCTHATVCNGKITAFVCCPSNDLLMTYHDATPTGIGRMTLQWTQDFLSRLSVHPRWHSTRLTGHFSMDFIYQPARQRLVVIECNPRVHTAICLLRERPELGSALDGNARSEMVLPRRGTSTVSWVGHDLFARLLPNLLPSSLARRIYGSESMRSASSTRFVVSIDEEKEVVAPTAATGTAAEANEGERAYDLEEVGVDGAWEEEDGLSYFALYHVQWPFLLLRQALLRRRAFSRINVSTARIFEC